MTRKKHSPRDAGATAPVDVTFGTFHIGQYRVPYMQGVLLFREVAEYLNLVTDDEKYTRQNWSISELFQREVNQKRVVDIADNYLNPTRLDRPPFFNSLTVVLRSKTRGSYSPPEPDSDFNFNLCIGPVRVGYDYKAKEGEFPMPRTAGVIRWNRDEVYALAIDGQHRLAAIQHLAQSNPDAAAKCDISVIFLLLDPAVGFVAPTEDSLRWMRSLFIDLNKHAVPVTRARNLLLDDLDPTARFLRELFSPCLNYEPTAKKGPGGIPVGSHGEFHDRVPLSLIDWHGESKSKVEKGPYVTSVLALEWIVLAVLAGKQVRSRELSPDEENYYEDLRRDLSAWEDSWRTRLEAKWTECKQEEKPLVLDEEDLAILSLEFRRLWGKPMTRLLTNTGPYKDLAESRVTSKTLCTEFGQWYQAVAALEEHTRDAKPVRDRYEHTLAKAEASLKSDGFSIKGFREEVDRIETEIKRDSVFFYLVGQRAIVQSLVELAGTRQAAYWAQKGHTDLRQFGDCMQDFYAYYLSEALNALHSNPLKNDGVFHKLCLVDRNNQKRLLDSIQRYFWAGSLTKRDDPNQMDFSMAAAKRGAKWFVLMAHLYWFIRANPRQKATLLLTDLPKPDELAQFPFGDELQRAIGDVLGRKDGGNRNSYPMSFIVQPTEEGWTSRDWQTARAAAKERIDHLVKSFGSS